MTQIRTIVSPKYLQEQLLGVDLQQILDTIDILFRVDEEIDLKEELIEVVDGPNDTYLYKFANFKELSKAVQLYTIVEEGGKADFNGELLLPKINDASVNQRFLQNIEFLNPVISTFFKVEKLDIKDEEEFFNLGLSFSVSPTATEGWFKVVLVGILYFIDKLYKSDLSGKAPARAAWNFIKDDGVLLYLYSLRE